LEIIHKLENIFLDPSRGHINISKELNSVALTLVIKQFLVFEIEF
jgi:hypothetical protein